MTEPSLKHPSLNIVIACGGTGGHLFPGIAVAQELKKRGHRVTLLISQKKVDAQASKSYGDLDFRTIEAIAMPKIPSLSPAGVRRQAVQSHPFQPPSSGRGGSGRRHRHGRIHFIPSRLRRHRKGIRT